MNNWRRQRGENHNPESTRTRSHNKKPPIGSWQPTVPLWEKKFCTSVGSVPWRKILEIKKLMYLYNNIVNWNDSAGEEAFHNAKTRFYAEIHSLPCDIALPDPDIYIDEVDWDSKIDPELILDLEREPEIPDPTKEHEHVVIFNSSLYENQGFASTTGWGDEEDLKKAANSSSENNHNRLDCDFHQSNEVVEGNNGWGDSFNNSLSWDESNGANMGESGWGDGWNNFQKNDYRSQGVRDRMWPTWDDANNGRREGTGRYMSRYKTSRFSGEDYHQQNYAWRNGNGRKRVNFVSEKPARDTRQFSRQWNARGRSGDSWSWDKPVL